MKKSFYGIVFLVFLVLAFANVCEAKSFAKIDKLLKSSSDLDKTATIAISVKDAQSGAVEFEYNQNKLLHTASTLKLFSTAAAIDTLGEDYQFKTAFYTCGNDLYIKLGADPRLTKEGLKDLVKELRSQNLKNFNNVYFDDSIFDRQEWGTGWMWDNDTNPYMPKFSAYNIDGNVINVTAGESANGDVKIASSSKYPMSVVNLLSFGQGTKFMVNRYDWTNPEVVELIGTIKGKTTVTVPISSMRRYFIYVLNDLFSTYNIKIKNASYNSKLIPSDANKVAEVTTPVSAVYTSILQNSDNKDAETLFKVATANKYSATATSELESRFFKEYWNGKRVPSDSISIADASGASRNNLVSVDWMTNALVKIYNNDSLYQTLKYNMAQPGDGTLSTRLFDLRGEAWLKTGSLAGVSGITGFVTDKKGKTYVVAILIQNFVTEPKNVKAFEDEVIKVIYE